MKQKNKSVSVNHLKQIHENDEYGTPRLIFFEACKKYNVKPKIDYFSSEFNHVVQKYYTQNDNAMDKEWTKDGFVNPPYSRKYLPKIIKKCYEEHRKYNITLLVLTYAKTDTKWWHNYVEGKAEYYFHKGRISFNDKYGIPTKNKAPYPSVWIIYRKITTSRDFEMKQMFGDKNS
jgi:phage N-6-adenine-methyltransferase